MGKLVISTAMTVDGLIDVTDWYVSEGGHDRASLDQFHEADAMLLGRKTYEGLAGFWSPLEGPWADRLNEMPKFVASRTFQGDLEWKATVLEGEVAESVPQLKEELDRDLVLVGCGELARDLLGRGLIDEVRFWVHPALGGEGARPFQGEKARLALVDAKTFDSGVMLLRYAPA